MIDFFLQIKFIKIEVEGKKNMSELNPDVSAVPPASSASPCFVSSVFISASASAETAAAETDRRTDRQLVSGDSEGGASP